jgi:hypothetical protein
MISKKLIASAGIAASLVWASTANAATLISIGLQQAGVNGGAITGVGSSGTDSANFNGAYGDFNINLVTGLAADNAFSTTSNNHAMKAATLNVFVTLQGIDDPTGAFAVLSAFTENGLPSGFSVTETTYFNSDNALFGTNTFLATKTFTGPVTNDSDSSLAFVNVLTTPYSVTAKYTIVAGGAGTANSTITISAETPLPGTLPLIASGLGALWMVGRKRKARKTPAVA